MRWKFLLAGIWAAVFSPVFSRAEAVLRGVDIYRSSLVTEDRLGRELGSLIETYARQRNDDRPSAKRTAERTRSQVEAKIRKMGKFAYVSLYYAEYVTSAQHNSYITLDLVDAAEAKSRMPFRRRPTRRLPDPDSLLASWQQYSDLGRSIMREGRMPMDRPRCPAFYCLWGPVTPELQVFEGRFSQAVGANKDKITALMRFEADFSKRAVAAYLLSYLPRGEEVTALMYEALEDPAEEVRAAALQVLADIATYHKSVFIDVKRLIPALDFPTASDRSKTMAVLVGLSDNASYRPYLISRAGPRLLELLKMKQPNHHDLAFTLLSMLSGESHGRRDYGAWEGWVLSQKKSEL